MENEAMRIILSIICSWIVCIFDLSQYKCFMIYHAFQTLEKNYKTWCSLQEKKIPEGFVLKEKVEEILADGKFDKKRARQMDQDDFLALLHAFNKEGIHFV